MEIPYEVFSWKRFISIRMSYCAWWCKYHRKEFYKQDGNPPKEFTMWWVK